MHIAILPYNNICIQINRLSLVAISLGCTLIPILYLLITLLDTFLAIVFGPLELLNAYSGVFLFLLSNGLVSESNQILLGIRHVVYTHLTYLKWSLVKNTRVVYAVSSRIAEDTQENPDSKNLENKSISAIKIIVKRNLKETL